MREIDWSAVALHLAHIDWTAVATCFLAIFTAALAWGTFRLVREARQTRMQDERRKRELAFRAAIDELGDNIINFKRWNPGVSTRPDQLWFERHLQFKAFNTLLVEVEFQPQLWERISAMRTHIEVHEAEYRQKAERSIDDRYTHEGPTLRSDLSSKRPIIDLYLKQLACYVACAAGQQGFGEIENLVKTAERFRPIPWTHGSPTESQLLPPFFSLPPEPDDSACQRCKLETLIGQAGQRAEQQSRAAFSGMTPSI